MREYVCDALLNATKTRKYVRVTYLPLKLPQHKHKYADWVSSTGAPKYFFIVAHSSFQSQMWLKWSHCRALHLIY